MFPVAAGVDAGCIGKRFEAGYFFRCQDGIHSLCGFQYVTLLGGSDDRHRAFGKGPGDAYLRAGEAVSGADFSHCVRKCGKLAQDGIVFLAAVAALRQGILHVVFPGEGALLQHHIGPEPDTVLLAKVQHAAFLGRAVQQAEMVLHGAHLETCFTQDFICAADFLDVVV